MKTPRTRAENCFKRLSNVSREARLALAPHKALCTAILEEQFLKSHRELVEAARPFVDDFDNFKMEISRPIRSREINFAAQKNALLESGDWK